jgi:putative N6-adenine-specific DNA methylase
MRVSSHASRLYHTGAIEERLRRTIGAPATERRPADDDQLVVVRVDRDDFTISIDASGAPLYKRGWRARSTRSPLRESLAAAMLAVAGWRGHEPLIDPFCGSGTIAIEAALLAGGRAPGSMRGFAFERWPCFEPGTWASVRAEVESAAMTTSIPVSIWARDRDEGAVEIATENAERAGVKEWVDIRRATISELIAPTDVAGTGWVISNPPYGRRVSGGRDVRDLYARFGRVARDGLAGWRVGLLVADPRAVGHAGLDWTERFRTDNGGIPVRFVTTTA